MTKHQPVPAIDALMNADDELALVTDDADLTRLTAVSYRRRDGALTGHHADGSTRNMGRLAKPMIGRLQAQTTVLLVIQMSERDVQETTLPLNRLP